jgi:hypothetical protein
MCKCLVYLSQTRGNIAPLTSKLNTMNFTAKVVRLEPGVINVELLDYDASFTLTTGSHINSIDNWKPLLGDLRASQKEIVINSGATVSKMINMNESEPMKYRMELHTSGGRRGHVTSAEFAISRETFEKLSERKENIANRMNRESYRLSPESRVRRASIGLAPAPVSAI